MVNTQDLTSYHDFTLGEEQEALNKSSFCRFVLQTIIIWTPLFVLQTIIMLTPLFVLQHNYNMDTIVCLATQL